MTCIICTSCTKNTFRAKDSTLHSWCGNLKHKNILPFKVLWSIIWLDLNTKSKNYINWINMNRNYLWLVPTPKQYIQKRKKRKIRNQTCPTFFGVSDHVYKLQMIYTRKKNVNEMKPISRHTDMGKT